MDIRQESPPRVDRNDDGLLTDDDERALEAIRRQLDVEFPHSTDTVAVAAPAAHRRRVRAATVLGVLLVCASGGAAAVLVTPVYQALTAQPPVERESPPAARAPVTSIVAAARPAPPAAPAPPPRHAEATTEPAGRRQATRAPEPPVPDVIRLREAAPPSTAPVAFVSVPPRVAAAPTVERGSSAATAPITSLPPFESAVAALAPLPLAQLASEHVRAAWGTVREGVMRASGEFPRSPRSGPEAP